MEISVESMAPHIQLHTVSGLRLRMLGPLSLTRGEATVSLPRSRKVRGLLAYLALASYTVSRSHLAGLLWDLPDSSHDELRWCLSKLRGVINEPGRTRVLTEGSGVRLDVDDIEVDALIVQRAIQNGLTKLDVPTLRRLAEMFEGDFLEGLSIERSALFSAWLLAQRRSLRAARIAILERLVQVLPPTDDETIATLETWVQLAPLEQRAHKMLLTALAQKGQLREGEEHLAVAARLFEVEGLDWYPLGQAWGALRSQPSVVQPASEPAASVTLLSASPPTSQTPDPTPTPYRASVVVMPFVDQGNGGPGSLAGAMTYDITARLAKLRSLFVIAQGTAFALQDRQIGFEEAGRRLGVDYVVSGTFLHEGARRCVAVQLTETRSARVVWAEFFDAPVDQTLTMLDKIGDRIVMAISSQIEQVERNLAILKPPELLNAWEAYHRGLWHMFHFEPAANEQAKHFFELAIKLDPGFSRPYAGLSFAHFQKAFQGWGEREQEVELAYRSASQAVMADELDPTAHWALGRALWLRGSVTQSLGELSTSVNLSPNFALGHYTLGFVQAQSGDPDAAIRATDHSRELSPYDPMMYAMFATRAIALLRLGRIQDAAEWAVKGAARPNAHSHIFAIAAVCLTLAQREEEAQAMAATLHRRSPQYRIGDLLAGFRFQEETSEQLRHAAGQIGLG